MTNLIGQLPEFDSTKDSIMAYVTRVKLFIDANSIDEGRSVPVLLSLIGGKTYDLLRNLLSLTDTKEKTFDEPIETLSGHFELKPIVIAERFHFHKRHQAAGKSVTQLLAELRRLARYCEFKTFLEEALRDRFVCGLHAKPIQNRLLTEKNLTLTKAFEVAVSMEAAAKEVTELQATSQLSTGATPVKGDVLKVTANQQISFYCCGISDHKPALCPVKGFRPGGRIL